MGVVCWLLAMLIVKNLFWGYVLERQVYFIGFLTGLQLTTLICVLKYCRISLNLLITSTSHYWKPVFLFLKRITFLKEIQEMDPSIMDFQNWKKLSMSCSLTANWNCELSLKHPRPVWTCMLFGHFPWLGISLLWEIFISISNSSGGLKSIYSLYICLFLISTVRS